MCRLALAQSHSNHINQRFAIHDDLREPHRVFHSIFVGLGEPFTQLHAYTFHISNSHNYGVLESIPIYYYESYYNSYCEPYTNRIRIFLAFLYELLINVGVTHDISVFLYRA